MTREKCAEVAREIYDSLNISGPPNSGSIGIITDALMAVRDEAFEECAKVAKQEGCGREQCTDDCCSGNYIAAAIRAKAKEE